MKLKKLLTTLLAVFTFAFLINVTVLAQPFSTVYVDVTNGSDTYSGQNSTNNPAGAGPKASITAGLGALSNSGTLVIFAGDYTGATNNVDISTANYAALTSGLTMELRPLNANVNINIDNAANQFVFNISGGTLNIVSTGGAKINLTDLALTLTAGNVNIDAGSSLVLPNGATITINGSSALTGAAPNKGANLNLVYTGGNSFTAGPESNYGSYGSGTITVNKTSGTLVTFPNNITAVGGIVGTAGNASFSGAVNLAANDLTNNGTGTLTFDGAVTFSLTDGVADANIGSVENAAGGSIIINGAVTWASADITAARTYPGAATTYLIDNQSNGTIAVNNTIALTPDPTTAFFSSVVSAKNSGGTLTLGTISANTANSVNVTFSVSNLVAGGTLNLAGGNILGNLSNVASATINVTGATTVGGTLTNAGNIVLGASNLTLSSSQAHATAGGTITAGAGGVIVTTTAGGNSFNGGNLSNLTINGAGGTTTITGAVNLSGLTVTAGTLTTGANVTVSGTATVNGGTLNVGNFNFQTLNLQQTSGIFALANNAASILDIKGDLNRTSGTFTAPALSTVQFTGTIAQTINGGSLFQVGILSFNNSVSAITVGNSIRATGNVTVATATRINFGTTNLILNGGTNGIVNNGNYDVTTGSGGGVVLGGINTVVGGAAGAAYTMEGTGVYSYVTVDVGAGNTASVINTVTGVKWSGVLTLRSGTLDVGTAGVDFSPFGSSASIIRYVQDSPGITTSAGTFNAAAVQYDLTYTGAITANQPTGNELNANARTWTVATTGAFTNNLPAAGFNFGGTLIIENGAVVNILADAGAGDVFQLSGAGKNHIVRGAIAFADAGDYLLVSGGTSTITGSTTVAHVATIDDIQISSTSLTITDIQAFSSTFITLGGSSVTLGMGAAAAEQVITGAITLGGTALTLTTSITSTAGVTHNGGTLDFGGNTLITNAAFTETAGSYSSTGGYLQFNTGAVLTLTSAIPYLRANDVAVTLGSNVTVSQNLDITDPAGGAAGTITSAGFNLTISNGMTTVGGTVFTGTGALILAGTTVTASGDPSISNLTVNSAGVATLASNNATVRTFTVPGVLTLTAGELALGANNVSLTGTGAILARTNATVSAGSGQLIFAGAGAQTASQGTGFTVPNLTIMNTAGVTFAGGATNDFTVTGNLRLTSGTLSSTTAGKLHVGVGATITRVADASSLVEVPTFDGDANLVYANLAGAGPAAMANEAPVGANGSKLNNITINPGATKTINTGAATVFKGTLTLASGTFGNVGGGVTATSGATIARNGGDLGFVPTVTNYNLSYGAAHTTTSNEFQNGAGISVDLLTINTSGNLVTMHAARTVKDFTLTAGTFNNGGFNLTVTGNINLAGGTYAGAGQLILGGTAAQTFTVPAGGLTLTGNLTLNNSTGVTLAGGNLTMASGNVVNFTNGIITTGSNVLTLVQTNTTPGYTRSVVAPNLSHVVGYIQHNITTGAGGVGINGRYEFPIGTATDYRPFAIVFTGSYPAQNPTAVIVSHVDASPEGTTGLPIDAGDDLFIRSYPDYYWLVRTNPSPFGVTQLFDVETYATDISFSEDLRIIRRQDGNAETNPWVMQGTNANYSNFQVITGTDTTSVVRTTASIGGVVNEGTRFTIGLPGVGVNTFPVSGTVTYDNAANTPLSGVVVTLTPGGQTATTDASGQYTIADVANGDYTITASSSATWPGANATDALLISNHYNGTALLSGLRLTAADVNGSSSVNNTDALLVVRRFAGLDNSFAAGDWVFSSASVTVNNDTVPDVDLDGLAVGDVNGSDTPTLLKQGANTVSLSSNGKLQVNPTDAFEVSVKVSSAMNVGAFGLRFNYPSELVSFEGVSSKFSGTVYKAENNMITIAWADFTGKQAINLKETDALLTLKFKPTTKFEVGTKFNVELDGSYSELASSDGKVFAANLQVSSIESFVPADFGLRQNYPNPFNPSTTIEYDMPVAGNVSLIIYNVLGEQVSVLVNEFQKAGAYKFNWVANNLPSGVYIYRLNVEAGDKNFSQNHRMMLLK